MPILTIPPEALIGQITDAPEDKIFASTTTAYNLFALMLYPNDEAKRVEIEETFSVKFFHDSDLLEDLPAASSYSFRYTKKASINKYKARSKYPESLSKHIVSGVSYREVLKRFKEKDAYESWHSVIALTSIFLSLQKHHADLPGGVSLRKATDLMVACRDTKRYNSLQNQKDILKAWESYKDISHLLFA